MMRAEGSGSRPFFSNFAAQGVVKPFPIAGHDPSPAGPVDLHPRRKVVGQAPPLTAGSQPVKNGVNRFPAWRNRFSSFGRYPYGKERFLEKLPLVVGQVGVVGLAVHKRSPEEFY